MEILSQNLTNNEANQSLHAPNNIEIQSTQDKSPLLVTPKPPRPDKSGSILHSESAVLRSNRAEKEKLIGLRRTELTINVTDENEA